ncbi:hypothetical protein L5654_23590, partial [Klebsiella grimontii]|uniref:hypothetical protein n=1 Tax=Klebsiella grimontii TaxID=2058152 RepID=UPI001ED9EDE4
RVSLGRNDLLIRTFPNLSAVKEHHICGDIQPNGGINKRFKAFGLHQRVGTSLSGQFAPFFDTATG